MEKEIYKIPIKYKDNLEQRFNEKNAVKDGKYFLIPIECKPCAEVEHNCKDCFFHTIPYKKNGCNDIIFDITSKFFGDFINIIMIFADEICWHINDNRKARQMLKRLRNEARKRIEFVEEN